MTRCASLRPTTMATDLLVAVAQRAKSALKADREVHLKLARTVVVAVKVVVVVAAKVVVGAAEVAAEAAADREIDRAEDAVVDLALLLAKNSKKHRQTKYSACGASALVRAKKTCATCSPS